LGWTAALLALPQPMARKFKRWWKRDGHEGMAIDPKVMGSVIILAAFMGSLYD
jgi:hypothetical protein